MAVNLTDDNVYERNKRFVIDRETVQINEPTDEYQDFGKPFIDNERQTKEIVDIGDGYELTENINRESVDVDTRESDAYTIETREKYEVNTFSSNALPESEFSELQEVDRVNVENRISEVSDRLGLFLYNLVPYQALNAVSGVGAAIENPDVAGLLTSSAMTSLSGLQKLKYFTPAELALTLGHNFYTLHFLRGVTVKKGRGGALGISGPASQDDIWTGEVDLSFGRDSLPSFSFSQIQNAAASFFGGSRDIAESSNAKLAQLKDGENGITPTITITPTAVIQRRKSSFVDQLSNDNKMIQSATTDIMTSVLKDQDTIGTRWNGRDVFDEVEYAPSDIQNRDHETEQNEYLINPDVLKIAQRVNDSTNNKWDLQSEGNPTREDFTFREAEVREWDTNRNNYLINPNVQRITFRANPTQPGETEGTIQELVKGKGFVNSGNNQGWQIGAVYVIPVIPEGLQAQLDLNRFFIPFEFNPEIAENSIGARYQQTQVLSRIGDLQSYTGTNSLSLSLTTKYQAVAHEEYSAQGDQSGNFGHEWMSEFTLSKLQAIELAYRSLVYPHFPDQESLDTGYVYVKPPLLKVIIGDYTNNTQPYANLLTYQNDTVIEGKFQNSGEKWGSPILRTFIATEVGIKKDLMESPVYLNENRTLRDTFGFEVTMSLTEVSPNYLDTMPNFKSRFNQYRTVMSNYIES